MEYIIGIDQGSSKTHALLLDKLGNIYGLGKSYGACHFSHGMENAMSAVKDAVSQALSQSGIDINKVSFISAGMAGADWDFEEKLLSETLKSVFPVEKIKVVNDCIIAMRAGTDKDYGSTLCAGSGLNCVVRNADKSQIVFGYYIDEKCSGGISLGEMAIKAVTDAYIGLCPDTILTQMLLDYFMVTKVDELLYKKVTGAISQNEYLYLPILLDKAAMENDSVALKILADYGNNIAMYVVCGMRKLCMMNIETEVILTGSIFKCKSPVLKEAVAHTIHKHAVYAKIIDAVFEPVIGAALFGFDEFYTKLPPKVYKNLEKSAVNFQLKRIGNDGG